MRFLHGLLRQIAGEGILLSAIGLAAHDPGVGMPLLPAVALVGVWGIVSGVELACWSEIAEFERRSRF